MFSQGDLFSLDAEKSLPSVSATLWERLARSAFRGRFHLNTADLSYLQEKTLPVVLEHGADFIAKRLAPAHPARDGKQTPWKGHPVFVAQHATGTCCRSCLEKWHHFSKGQSLTSSQQHYVLAVIAGWLEQELARASAQVAEQSVCPATKEKNVE
ncbi:DUF4186 domain-containing protein [Acetobacter orleanensis]|uniref:DUF4186 domain-containing protein n=1 Tax=Acetobacter orleanensis TaxID=104099 RepID=UPI00066273F7|nr:DUF4186 domain-containing protein [Acetobacter orleanensis]KXV62356.1 hypothetical protein AD949_11390 [Acetobacter orleanensis]PCD79426.1 DUF4186 domain-containing protein [Acetobacter orleanensis]